MPNQVQKRGMESDEAEQAKRRQSERLNEKFQAEVAAAFASAHRARLSYILTQNSK